MVNMVITNFGKCFLSLLPRVQLCYLLAVNFSNLRRADDDNNAGSFRQLASSALAQLRVILDDDRRKTSRCNEMIVSMEELEFGNIGMYLSTSSFTPSSGVSSSYLNALAW
ncbi:hypothetical protein ABKN59_003030 [Abortiporus biennis]